ncbi:hypothetical protein DCCM_3161 [Desulfocucumis palustris]|uniref:Uncharacterized protein n=1 Tax=Desulfocucumis palustris TaxID=1898651 RepID=A0A2L2XD29_9FIRM|nr:EcsC family protein [Desulfocucumis palustris]GBF34050.1 hypothetical protein DCCM_3161 [Desulfocucumis palustris]
MFYINPFDYVNKNDVRKRVLKIKKKNQELNNRQLCEMVIKNKSRWCAASGAVTALPGAFPGLGTVVAVLGGTALDITALSYFMSEMILEMSAIYGRDLNIPAASREALWVFVSAVSSDLAGKGLARAAAARMGRQAVLKLLQELLLSLGIRVSQRSLLKIIPVLGTVISSAVNYYICKKIGAIAADYYEKSSFSEWQGTTIDI